MDGKWLSYADAAAALGMTPESVRQRARREHWRKQLGNDGRALILVPADTDRISPGDPEGETSVPRPMKRPEPDAALTILQTKLADAEARLLDLRADVERERGERLQERERADRLTDEVATLARQLAQAVQEAGSRESNLRDQLAQAREAAARDKAHAASVTAEMEALRSQPWWRRLAG